MKLRSVVSFCWRFIHTIAEKTTSRNWWNVIGICVTVLLEVIAFWWHLTMTFELGSLSYQIWVLLPKSCLRSLRAHRLTSPRHRQTDTTERITAPYSPVVKWLQYYNESDPSLNGGVKKTLHIVHVKYFITKQSLVDGSVWYRSLSAGCWARW